ncbi:MAG: hypothetical protein R3E56_10610 [Burkholderiaceae bacterium]
MSTPIRLGVLTPSSNTALEPLTSAIVATVPGASAHFSRFKVTEISLKPDALGQFDDVTKGDLATPSCWPMPASM